MDNRLVRVLAILLILALAACHSSSNNSGGARRPFTYSIDPSIAPLQSEIPDTGKGPRPLASLRDENGVVSVFVENEVILETGDPSAAQALVAKYGGTLVETNEIPQPPARLRGPLSAEETRATEYTIRIDPSTFSLDRLSADGEAAGFGGDRTFSSDRGARLWAILMSETAGGATVGPNFSFTGDGSMLLGTEEHPSGSAFFDALGDWNVFWQTGSRSDVTRAWRFVAAHGFTQKVNVAIIDGGFWLDGNGFPGAGATSDLPTANAPFQYDFDGDDYVASGTNPASCSGGSACPYHGNNSASVAMAILNNQYGAAGTGGQVAEPFLFKTDLTRSQIKRAVKTAAAWGIDIVSMSFGGACNLDCWTFMSSTFTAFYDAQKAGVTLIAAAGNENTNLDNEASFPCSVMAIADTPGVICVGALKNSSIMRYDTTSNGGWGSNYGSAVDIWAPTNIPAMPHPDPNVNSILPGTCTGAGNDTCLRNAGGTSASTPFVAGIAAMLKAMDPSLTPSGIQAILQSTAGTDSPDDVVKHYVNAFDAVKKAANEALPPDLFEPNDNKLEPKSVGFNFKYQNLSIFPDWDYYTFMLDDFYDVSINFTYMDRLGEVKMFLIDDGGLAPPVSETVNTTDDARQYLLHQMAPGTYTMAVQGTALNLYHMELKPVPTTLTPDQFEVNDTFGTAAAPANGSYKVTLHNPGDVDYYAFTVAGLSAIQDFVFGVGFSDAPLTLRLYKGGVDQGTFGPSKTPSITLHDPDSYVIQVAGAGMSRYQFTSGISLDKSIFTFAVPVEQVFVIDPTDGPEHWLVGPADGFAFTQGSRITSLYQGFEMLGEGLHLRLLDSAGNLIGEGQPYTNIDGFAGETIPFDGTVSDQAYLLLVERANVPDLSNVLLPAVQYSLTYQAAGP